MIVTGSLESNDCMITLSPSETFALTLESVVYAAYGKHIERLIESLCRDQNQMCVAIHCQDQGALDVTIKARLHEALTRYAEATHA